MSKKHKRYDPLITYRDYIEKEFQKECQRMQDLLLIEETKLLSLEMAQERSIIELQEKQEAEITLHEATVYYSFLNNVTHEIDKQRSLLEDIKSQFELKREELLLAHRNKRIVEILKEKELTELFHIEDKKDQKFLDDLSEKKHWREQRSA